MALKSNFTLRLEDVLHLKLKEVAKKEKRSLSNLIGFFLLKEMEQYEAEFGEIQITEE